MKTQVKFNGLNYPNLKMGYFTQYSRLLDYRVTLNLRFYIHERVARYI